MSNTNTVENTNTEMLVEEKETSLTPVSTESVLTESQEQALQTVEPEVTPYSNEDVEQLKAIASSEDAPESFYEERQQDVMDGRLTKEQFADILGVEYEEPESDVPESESDVTPGIGHNKPPENINPTALEVADELKAFKPTVENAAEAEKEVKEALIATVEHIGSSETSLASKGAIAIANWIAFNAGLRNDGNKLIAVNIGMYDKILASISGMVDSEDAKDPTFKSTVGQMIKRAILIMDGKLSIGYFVLPGDRKRVRGSDNASLEYPNDVPEGAKVVRSTVIRESVLRPRIPNLHPTTKAKIGEVDNSEATEHRLATNDVVDVMWKALWDRDGEIQYSPITGSILAFKTGSMVRDEIAKAEAAKARANAGEAEPGKRQTRGTQAEGNSLEQQNENLKEQLATAKQDAAAAVEAGKGDILSALNGLGAYIRDTSQPLPVEARVTFWKDANALFARRLIGPNVKPTKDEMRELTKLIANLDNHLKWDDEKGIWSFYNVDGSIVTTFGADTEDKAA